MHGVEGEQPALKGKSFDHRLRGGNFITLLVNLAMAQDQCVIDSEGVQYMSRLAVVEGIETVPERLAVDGHDW